MKQSRRTITTGLFFVFVIGVIVVTIILSQKVQKTDTTAKRTNAAGCAMHFVIGSPVTGPIGTPTPTPTTLPTSNPVSWQTGFVSLAADDFSITTANGKRFTGQGVTLTPHSDPGNSTYTSLELDWTEQSTPMRMFMYFHSDGTKWWVSEMRTMNGVSTAQYSYFAPNLINHLDTSIRSAIISGNLGSSFVGNFTTLNTTSTVPSTSAPVVVFKNLRLRGFLQFTGPQPTPTPTATPVARNLVYLARFAGVTKDIGPIDVKYMDADGVTTNLTFRFTSNGVYKALLSIGNQTLPTNLSFQLKPEKHLQRVFRNLPTSSLTFDLTATPFLPGDLPPQDGVVDLQDLNFVISILAKPTQTAEDKAVGDVNYDGVVNAADMSSILSTLSTRPDESL